MLVAVPAISRAEDSTNTPAATTPTPKKHGTTFHGKVAAVDPTAAMTFTVGTMTIACTSETKIMKDGQPVGLRRHHGGGATVSGAYKKEADGKLTATTVIVSVRRKRKARLAAQESQSGFNSKADGCVRLFYLLTVSTSSSSASGSFAGLGVCVCW